MATKRPKRIDPSAAFASIVGAEPLPKAAEQESPGAGEGAPQAPAAVDTRPAAPQATAAPASVAAAPASVAAAPASVAAAEPPETPAPAENVRKLVQKGYYLYDDQAKQLAVYAAVTGADKSSIVRAALQEYFENHPAT